MRKGAIAAGVVAGIVAAAVLWRLSGPAEPAAAADAPRPVGGGVPVTAGIVAKSDVPVLLQAIGSVQAYNMVTIRSRVDGQIVKADFAEGQEVKAGMPLFQIDPRPFKATLDQALANQEKDQANLANAQLILARDAKIVGANLAVSQQQFTTDQATAAADKGIVDGDKAQAELARLNLEYSTIKAPIDGRLGARLVDVGNLVHASDTTGLITIAQVKPIFVSFTLPQEAAYQVREEQARAPLEVRAYDGNSKALLATGKLTLIDNAIDPATGTIHLKAAFANTDERLWPGEFVNAQVVLSVRKGVPTVPAQTVQEGPNGHYVYVIEKDDTVKRRTVEVLSEQQGIAAIGKGLEPGERVVIDGQYRLVEGARVRIQQAPPRSGAAG